MRVVIFSILLCCSLSALVAAWSKEDHEIFRLRDEVEASEGSGVTFYDFLGVTHRASADEINKAFRRKSRLIHPDKAKQSFIASKFNPPSKANAGKAKRPEVRVNKGPSQREVREIEKKANDRFARLGVVANILKGPGRERYDHFLNNGFPKWRGTGYYYARLRPGLGSVLVGLFVLGGGAAHYAAMYLGWKRQREFVGRYIRHARQAAWGDEMGINGIPGMDTSPGASAPPPQAEAAGEFSAMNRRQKRMLEKESKKEKDTKKSKGGRVAGADTASDAGTRASPSGDRKRVIAENGKVLIVDAVGNVFLEEEGENGDKEEYLLDVEEIPKPTFGQTVLVRFPVWLFRNSVGRVWKQSEAAEEAQDVATDYGTDGGHKSVGQGTHSGDSTARRRGKGPSKRNGGARRPSPVTEA